MNVDYKLIGSRIKAARNSLGYTQEWLAEKLDVTVGYISQVERGITKISLDLLAEISTILNCDIATLIVGATVQSGNYLSPELNAYYSKLDKADKKLVAGFIKLLIERNGG